MKEFVIAIFNSIVSIIKELLLNIFKKKDKKI